MSVASSSIDALIIVLALLRRAMRLENFIREVHVNNLGILLLAMCLLWLYFTISEYLTVYYGNEPVEMSVLAGKVAGRYAPAFWTMVVTCFLVPVAILARKRTRTIAGTVVASLSVCIASR